MRLWVLTDTVKEGSFIAGVFTSPEAAKDAMENNRFTRDRAIMGILRPDSLLYPEIVEVEANQFRVTEI